jgi:hypothetical protein
MTITAKQRRTYINRLRRLSAFLRTLPPERFNFRRLVLRCDTNGCGTVCCAVGWLPAVDKRNWKWSRCIYTSSIFPELRGFEGNPTIRSLSQYFGINTNHIIDLFYPGAYGNQLKGNATAIEVADHIDKFIHENRTAFSGV